jgi:hypothetical protein
MTSLHVIELRVSSSYRGVDANTNRRETPFNEKDAQRGTKHCTSRFFFT